MKGVAAWCRAAALAWVVITIMLGASRARATSPKVPDATAPLKVWHAYRGAEQLALDALLKDFDGEVDVLAIPYDAFGSKLAAAIPLGEGPDLFIDSHERLGDFIHRGLVAPVAPALIDRNAYVPQALDAITLPDAEGIPRGWAIPLSMKSVALYVNTDLLPTVPAHLEDFAGLTERLPDGVFPLAWEANSAYTHAAILGAYGGTLLTVDGEFGMQGEAATRSLQLVLDLLDAKVLPEDANGALVSDLFGSGKAAAVISGPWLAGNLPASLNYDIRSLPAIADAKGYAKTDAQGSPALMRPLLTVESLMMSPDGVNHPRAAALVDHLTSAAAGRRRSLDARVLSARIDAAPAPTDTFLRAFQHQAALATPMPAVRAMRSVWEPASRAIRKTLRRDVTPARALEEAARRFRDVRRPPPDPQDPTPLLIILGALSLFGALTLLHRARQPALRAKLRASLPAYRYVIHGVILVGLLVIGPILVGAATALFAGQPHQMYYVGLHNFVDILTARSGPLFASGSFYLVLLVTVVWTALNVSLHLVLGVTLALVLSRPLLKLKSVYRVLLIIPWSVPSYVTALAWKGMFHRQFGAVTGLIHGVNDLFGTQLEPIAWFATFSTSFVANLTTNVWLGFPFMMVVTLGALTAVPKDVLEAAEVDGATPLQRLWHVTLPMIKPTMIPATVLGSIWTFNMFNVVFLVSGGEPDGTTDILISEAYRWAFTREARYGYAAAYAVLIFIILALASTAGARWIDRSKESA